MPEIEIVTYTKAGKALDRATATGLKAALVAARTLIDDAALGYAQPTASFYVDGMLVLASVERSQLQWVTL
jgi:hypothetical protein